MNLSQAKLKNSYRIQEVNGVEKKRLEDMGFIYGVELCVLSKAPFNGPLICFVNDVEIAIDYGLAKQVQITK